MIEDYKEVEEKFIELLRKAEQEEVKKLKKRDL